MDVYVPYNNNDLLQFPLQQFAIFMPWKYTGSTMEVLNSGELQGDCFAWWIATGYFRTPA